MILGHRTFLVVGCLASLFIATTHADSSSVQPFSVISSQILATLPSNVISKVPVTASKTDDTHTATSMVSTLKTIRGGGGVDNPTQQQLVGVAALTLIEVLLRKLFQSKGIRFPSQLAGCVAMFVIMTLTQAVDGKTGDAISNALSPGAGFLAKWMGVFFVPGLTMLPLAPSMGSNLEIVKILGLLVGGFFYSLFIVTYAVLGVRKLQGKISVEVSAGASSGAVGKKAFEPSTESFFIGGAVLTGALSIAMTRSGNYYKPTETLFLVFTTLASFVWGSNLAKSITQVVNPLLSSAMVTLAVIRLTAAATGSSFFDILRSYTCKKLSINEAGAGDLLLYALSPSVISFSVGMYKGRKLIAANWIAVLTAVLTGSLGSIFGTAFFARLLNLGGSTGQAIRLAAVPRSTQTALGMIIAEMLGGNLAIAATCIILTGILGGMVGVKTLNTWGVKDSVSRGLGIGSAGLALGAISIKNEPEAFAFAGLCLVLTAVAATCLASVPAISKVLINVAGGTGTIADAM